jgi:hypothetical protein
VILSHSVRCGTLTSQHATASCRELKRLATHGRSEAFRRSCRQRGETAGMRTAYLELTLQSCSLERCLSFVSDPPSFLLPSVAAKEQGGDGGESVDSTNRTSDSMINDKLFGGGG